MESRLSGNDVTFDPPTNDNDDEQHFTPAAYLTNGGMDPAHQLEHDDSRSQELSLMANSLKMLDERSKDIITRRWLSEDKTTLHELADEYQVSAERIRQIEKNALGKMRIAFEA
jgi:RNA polymerase sigma-32 factor